MEITSIKPGTYVAPAQPSITPQEAAQRRELIKATKAVNSSGIVGDQNEVTFVVNPSSHQVILRLVDRETGEVLMQVPPETILRMAQDLNDKT